MPSSLESLRNPDSWIGIKREARDRFFVTLSGRRGVPCEHLAIHYGLAVARTLRVGHTPAVAAAAAKPLRYSAALDAPLDELVATVRRYGFEGLVAKDPKSIYEPGMRSGAWKKMRVINVQEFVIGGYRIGTAQLRFPAGAAVALAQQFALD